MPNQLFRSLVGAGALALTIAIAPAAQAGTPAGAAGASPSAASGWTLTYRLSVGSVDYTLLGAVKGAPGNAHSGQIWFDTSDDEDNGVLHDWRCPAGVVPPTYYGGPGDPANPPTRCVNLRSVYADSGHALPWTDRGMTRAHAVSTHGLFDNVTGASLGRSVRSNYVLRGVGPTTTSVTYAGTPLTKSITKTRAATPTGRFGWISFDDPRLHVVSSQIIGEWDSNRS